MRVWTSSGYSIQSTGQPEHFLTDNKTTDIIQSTTEHYSGVNSAAEAESLRIMKMYHAWYGIAHYTWIPRNIEIHRTKA